MRSSTKCNFWYFTLAKVVRYLLNMLILPFLDYTQDSYDYWDGGGFKGPQFQLLQYSLRVFHTFVSWWSFNRIWVTASLLMPTGLFSVLWLILTMLWSRWFWLFLRFPTLPVPLPNEPITTGIIINRLFNSFLMSPVRSKNLSLFSCSLIFIFDCVVLCIVVYISYISRLLICDHNMYGINFEINYFL